MSFDLDFQNIRGQGYDGAGSVAGYKSGCQARISQLNRKALYTHCMAHRLNLVVSKSCKLRSVENMLSTVQQISWFLNFSEQRQNCFVRNIDELVPDAKKKRLKDVCRTRWVERILGLDSFEELLVPLQSSLEEMKLDLDRKFNKDTSARASQLYAALDYEFVVNLVVTRSVFDLSLSVTQLLQSKSNDIADGINMIESLLNLIHEIRKNVEILLLAKNLEIVEKVPRFAKKQPHRETHPFSSSSEYYKKSVTIPIVDHLLTEMNSRFTNESLVTYTGLYIIQSKLISLVSGGHSWKDKVMPFLKFYEDDLPNPKAIDAELCLWEKYWVLNKEKCPSNVESIMSSLPPSNILSAMTAIHFPGFENIKVVLRILATLPITSFECERSFSSMRRLKNIHEQPCLKVDFII